MMHIGSSLIMQEVLALEMLIQLRLRRSTCFWLLLNFQGVVSSSTSGKRLYSFSFNLHCNFFMTLHFSIFLHIFLSNLIFEWIHFKDFVFSILIPTSLPPPPPYTLNTFFYVSFPTHANLYKYNEVKNFYKRKFM